MLILCIVADVSYKIENTEGLAPQCKILMVPAAWGQTRQKICAPTIGSTKTKTMSCKTALRDYLAAFDRTKKDFSEVNHLFDAVSHKKIHMVMEGETLDRDTAKAIDAGYLGSG